MRREKAEGEKEKIRKKKSEENKVKETKMWNRLSELNSESRKIKQFEKEDIFSCKNYLLD